MFLQIQEVTEVTKVMLEKGATTNPTADPSGSLLVMSLLVGGIFFMVLSGALIYIILSSRKANSASAPAPATAPPANTDAYDIDLIKSLTKIETLVTQIFNHIVNDRVRH